MKELTIEELTTEAMQLLPLGIDDLYMALGCQLLAFLRWAGKDLAHHRTNQNSSSIRLPRPKNPIYEIQDTPTA